jgi:hypothetical protein
MSKLRIFITRLWRCRLGPQGPQPLMRLGTVEFAKKYYDPAADYFERAEGADAADATKAKLWMATAKAQQDKL